MGSRNPVQLSNERLASAREIARLMDTVFRVPGTRFRFGLDPLLGILPGVGDVVGGAFSAYLVYVAARLGAPAAVLLRMVLNVGIDALFGAVPLLGDLVDATFKANVRNLKLLETFVDRPADTHKRSKALLIGLMVTLGVMLLGAAWLAIALVFWILRVPF